MTIPEEEIDHHLNFLLNQADPGDSLHHMHVLASDPATVGPLGVPAKDQLQVSVYAIAPDNTVESPASFVRKTVIAAGIDHAKRGLRVEFAALAQEAWGVEPMDDLSRQLQAQGRLEKHPRAGELTVLYAACRDGRRWFATRWLSGPNVGQEATITVLTGERKHQDQFVLAGQALRYLVGIP